MQVTTANSSTQPATRRGLRWLAAAMMVAILATIALSAWARGTGGPGGMFMGSPEHMSHAVDHMLNGVNATDAQRAQIKQIVQLAADDLKAQREAGRALHEQGMRLFTAPTVDAAAAESLRQQMLTQHDTASRRMLQAMLDISRVLTPEQRTKLAEQMKQRHEQMRQHMQHGAEQPKQ